MSLRAAISLLFLLFGVTSCGLYSASSLHLLEHSVKKQILANQTHSYRIQLNAREYVRLALMQQSGKVSVRLISQDHKEIVEILSRVGTLTPISILTEKATEFILQVHSPTDTPVVYELNIDEKRVVLASDQLVIDAEKGIAKADQLVDECNESLYHDALGQYQLAAEILKKLGQKKERAYVLRRIGNTYHLIGNLEQALGNYEQALTLYDQCGDLRAKADVLSDQSILFLQQGKREKAEETCRQAQEISQFVDYKRGLAQSLTNQGEINNVLEKPVIAIRIFGDALRLWQELEDYEEQAETMIGTAYSYYYLGQYQKSINLGKQGLQLYQKVRDKRGEARALMIIGHSYSTIGDKQAALNTYKLAFSILQKGGDRVTEYSLIGGLGFVYEELGDPKKALEYREKALQLAQAVGYREDETLLSRYVGELHQILGNHKQALDHLQNARRLARASNDRRLEAYTLRSLGIMYQALGAKKVAMQYFQQAAALYPPAYTSRWRAYLNINIGSIYEQDGNLQNATAYYQQALDYNLTAEDRFGESQTRYHLATVHRKKGNWSAAVAETEKAVALIESLRARVSSQDLRTSYFASVNQIYKLYIDVLMQRPQAHSPNNLAADALTISERARARSLLDLLNDSRHNIKQGADPKLLEQERTLSQLRNSKAESKLQIAGIKEKQSELATLNQEIELLNSQIEDVRAKIRENSPRYAALTQPQPLHAAEIQQLLDDNTMLLEYALGEDRSHLWAVTKDSLTAFTLPKRAIIETLSSEVYSLLIAPQLQQVETPEGRLLRLKKANAQYWPKAAALSQMILAPVANQLGSRRLIVVADGALQRIPFAGLPMPKAEAGTRNAEMKPPEGTGYSSTPNATPLIVNHEIISLPSASILFVLRKERANSPATASQTGSFWDLIRGFFKKRTVPAPSRLDSVAILADPVFEKDDPRLQPEKGPHGQGGTAQSQTRNVDLSNENQPLNRLHETAAEAHEIEKAAGAKAFLLKTGLEVNRALLETDELNQYGILHFATHGYWDSNYPELSGLVLSRFDPQGKKQDGFLRLSDIYNLRLPKELVVLSACETAIGRDVRGEGLMALTRGFMYAGAARVIATLWKVDEGATVELMKIFYQKLLREKLTPAAALREAQIAMWRNNPTHAPYEWAAFTLQGEYR